MTGFANPEINESKRSSAFDVPNNGNETLMMISAVELLQTQKYEMLEKKLIF